MHQTLIWYYLSAGHNCGNFKAVETKTTSFRLGKKKKKNEKPEKIKATNDFHKKHDIIHILFL